MFLDTSTFALFARVMGPLGVSVLAYAFWYITTQNGREGPKDKLLVITYIISRLGIWLIFAVYIQSHVMLSDPRLYYTPMLEHFLAGDIPIREFFYPYGPLLIPSMLPFYQLFGHSLAGISLFAIFAEAIALFCFIKSTSLLEQRGEVTRLWVREALAIYLLNPATLYWTVFQGYHSIVQTAYSMAALYCLLQGLYATGYAVGLYGVAGSKFLAVLDWTALLAVCRPRTSRLLLGAIPLVMTYAIYQIITGDSFSPLRHHVNYMGEGNIWYLLTLLGDPRSYYSVFPGNLLPIIFFGAFFLLGWIRWFINLRRGLTTFSFHAAMGMTTFTMSLFFMFSFYSGSYYVPMLMLPASLIVTCPAFRRRRTVWSLLFISCFCVAGDAIWTSLGQPSVLLDAVLSDSLRERLLAYLLMTSILIRLACFATLAQLGLHAATMACPTQARLSMAAPVR